MKCFKKKNKKVTPKENNTTSKQEPQNHVALKEVKQQYTALEILQETPINNELDARTKRKMLLNRYKSNLNKILEPVPEEKEGKEFVR